MDKRRLRYLLETVLNNSASVDEISEYEEWYAQMQAQNPDLLADEISEDAVTVRESLLESIKDSIVKHETESGTAPVRRIYRQVAAAAAVLIIFSCGTLYFYFSRTTAGVAVAQVKKLESDLVRVTGSPSIVKKIQLSDGSSVSLFPGSEISYRRNFESNRREIVLQGKAFFEVARDNTKPFTVFSNNISTTALGTSFTITALKGRDSVEVALHTGRVVVKQRAENTVGRKEIYMVAGQHLIWHLSGQHANMISDAQKPLATKSLGKAISYGSRKGFVAEFNEAPLRQVLDKIQDGYSVEISYRPSEIKDMFFSGKIRATDSLSQVLQRIAVLQDLDITQSKHRYLIRKQH